MEKYCKSEESLSSTDIIRMSLSARLRARVWVISDLQQSIPKMAKDCFYTAIDDFKSLGIKCDKIWYLGDSVEGSNMPHLDEMTAMQEEVFVKLGIPLCYVLGNHDTDPLPGERRVPFYEMVKKHPGWKCIESCEDYYFFDTIADYNVLFISDHFSKDFEWIAKHGRVFEDISAYPYSKTDFKTLLKKVSESGKPTITASHYSYPGGNRSSDFMSEFMPLPDNVIMHFYGHAHIGDFRWAGKDAMRKISWIDNCDIPQFDVASLEYGRGSAVRSAFLEIYDDCIMVLFRDHQNKRWSESFVRTLNIN